MINAKLEYYREGQSEKHLTDIRSILRQPKFQDLRESADIQKWEKNWASSNSGMKTSIKPRIPKPKAQLPDSPQPATATLSDLELESIEYFVSFVQMVGLPKSIGEIYGVLFVSADPMALNDVVNRLGISKGSASQGFTVLRNLGAIRPVYVAGDRRDHYEADFDLVRIANRFFSEKLAPRFENGKERLHRMEALAAECPGKDGAHPAPIRIKALRKWQKRGQGLLPMILKLLGTR